MFRTLVVVGHSIRRTSPTRIWNEFFLIRNFSGSLNSLSDTVTDRSGNRRGPRRRHGGRKEAANARSGEANAGRTGRASSSNKNVLRKEDDGQTIEEGLVELDPGKESYEAMKARADEMINYAEDMFKLARSDFNKFREEAGFPKSVANGTGFSLKEEDFDGVLKSLKKYVTSVESGHAAKDTYPMDVQARTEDSFLRQFTVADSIISRILDAHSKFDEPLPATKKDELIELASRLSKAPWDDALSAKTTKEKLKKFSQSIDNAEYSATPEEINNFMPADLGTPNQVSKLKNIVSANSGSVVLKKNAQDSYLSVTEISGDYSRWTKHLVSKKSYGRALSLNASLSPKIKDRIASIIDSTSKK
ncbi:hypothetical protein V1511DRAFT_513661 [Dipodascopsis uninucleata]